MYRTDLAYRQTAVAGASGFGLLIALYDTLVGDLRRAAAAQRTGDLEKRAKEAKHALVVVGFLENWLEPESGDLAGKLKVFYSQVRRGIMQAQLRQSAAMLEEQMNEALRIRAVWQELDQRREADGPEILPPDPGPQYGGFHPMQMPEQQLSWSA